MIIKLLNQQKNFVKILREFRNINLKNLKKIILKEKDLMNI